MMKAKRPDAIVKFGSNLKYLRRKEGKTRLELAYSLGIQEKNIAEYETGSVEPSHTTLLQMSRYFNINLHEFIAADLNAHVWSGQDHLKYATMKVHLFRLFQQD